MSLAVDRFATSDALAGARDAWRHHERRTALEHLLRAWAAGRHPEVATAIDWMTEALQGEGARNVDECAWQDPMRQQDPIERGVLLATLADGTPSEIRARLEAIEKWAPDPRMTPALLGLLRGHRTLKLKKLEWRQVFTVLARLGDSRAIVPLEEPLGIAWMDARRCLTLAALKGAKAPKRLSEDHRAWLSAVARSDQADPTGEALREAVISEPSNHQRALVYADWLMQRGDPFGEFLFLQRVPKRTKDQSRRMRALLQENARDWLGPAHDALTLERCRFAGGFLEHAALRMLSQRSVTSLVGDPIWRTVRSVSLAAHSGRWALHMDRSADLVLDNPTMIAVRAVDGLSGKMLERVNEEVRPWEVLGIRRPWGARLFRAGHLFGGDALPKLRELRLQWNGSVTAPSLLADAPLLGRLDRLTIQGFDPNQDTIERWAMATRSSGVPELVVETEGWSLQFGLADGDWRYVTCLPRGRGRTNELAHLLEGVPADPVRRIDVGARISHVLLDLILERFAHAEVQKTTRTDC